MERWGSGFFGVGFHVVFASLCRGPQQREQHRQNFLPKKENRLDEAVLLHLFRSENQFFAKNNYSSKLGDSSSTFSA